MIPPRDNPLSRDKEPSGPPPSNPHAGIGNTTGSQGTSTPSGDADARGGPAERMPGQPFHFPQPFQQAHARLLLAEDNTINQKVAVGIVRKLGLRIDTVGNGKEALDALESHPYDLVLMDLQMPEMDGLEATREIRRREQAKAAAEHGKQVPTSHTPPARLPIIAITAYAMAGDHERCIAAGMDDYVTKPIRAAVLAEVLAKWLAQTSTNSDADLSPPREPSSSAPKTEETTREKAPVFDADVLAERTMDDPSLFAEVIQDFIEDTPAQVQALEEHLSAGELERAARQAHTLKGTAGNMAAFPLHHSAYELEKAAKSGDQDAADKSMQALRSAVKEAVEAMEKHLHPNQRD